MSIKNNILRVISVSRMINNTSERLTFFLEENNLVIRKIVINNNQIKFVRNFVISIVRVIIHYIYHNVAIKF